MLKKILLLGFSLAVAQPLLAKDYIIELIVFKQAALADGINWQPGVLLANDPQGLSVFGIDENVEFQMLETGPALAELAEQLANSRRHPLMSYRAWQQPGLARDEAEPVRFNVGDMIDIWDMGEVAPRSHAKHGIGDDYLGYTLATLNPELGGIQRRSHILNGTVTISLGRYLHLDSELVFTDLSTGMSTLQKSHRRMRSKRTHYIDNPVFGIIAHITPVEEPTEAEIETTTDG